ncbi:winged helix-turn-helix domain-containing protein, partial [Vibrio cholerae]
MESLIYILEDSVKFSVIDSTLTYGNKNHHLSYTETRILELLIKNSGSVVSKIQLIEYSWTGRVVAETSLAKSISNIRKVFRECEFHDDAIQTIPRLGYRLNLRSNVYEEKKDETSNLIFLEETKAISDSMAPRAMIKYANSYLGINFKKIISYLVCFILLSASVTFLYETIHSSHSNFIDPDYE